MQKLINGNNPNPCKLLSVVIIYHLADVLIQDPLKGLQRSGFQREASWLSLPLSEGITLNSFPLLFSLSPLA